MKVLFATSEVSPYSRAGGLADVSHTLPLALARMGHEVLITSPKYRQSRNIKPPLKILDTNLEVPISWMKKPAQICQARLDNQVTAYMIGGDDLYDRQGRYAKRTRDTT